MSKILLRSMLVSVFYSPCIATLVLLSMIDSFLMSMLGIMVMFTLFVCRWIDEVVVGKILQGFKLILSAVISGCFGIDVNLSGYLK